MFPGHFYDLNKRVNPQELEEMKSVAVTDDLIVQLLKQLAHCVKERERQNNEKMQEIRAVIAEHEAFYKKFSNYSGKLFAA